MDAGTERERFSRENASFMSAAMKNPLSTAESVMISRVISSGSGPLLKILRE